MIDANAPIATGTARGTFSFFSQRPLKGNAFDVELAVFEEGEHEGMIDTRALARTIRRAPGAPPLDLELQDGWTFRVYDTEGARIGTLEVHAGAGA